MGCEKIMENVFEETLNYDGEFLTEKMLIGKIVRQTDKAISLKLTNVKPFWLPKSQIGIFEGKDESIITLPLWLLQKQDSIVQDLAIDKDLLEKVLIQRKLL